MSSNRGKVDYASVPVGDDDEGPPLAFEIGGDSDDDDDNNNDHYIVDDDDDKKVEDGFHDEPSEPATTVRRRSPPVDDEAAVCCCFCCSTTLGRRRRCRRLSFCSILAYVIMLWLFIYIVSGSTPRGYVKDDQRLGPFSLLLLPLTPWVRQESRQEMPALTHSASVIQVLSNNNTNELHVVALPTLQMSPPKQINQSALKIHLGSELSGCDPKFILQDDQNQYLFKPNKDPHKVWNELLAYWINDIGQFNRVPPVWPFQLPIKDAKPQGKSGGISTQKLPFVKCNFDLDEMDKWIRTTGNDTTSSNSNNNNNNAQYDPEQDEYLLGTLQLMVHGVSKRSKAVNRLRSKIGKWSDKRPKPSTFAKREINTRSLYDSIIGNYDRYNNDFIQTKTNNGDKILVYIDQGSFVQTPDVGPTIFPLHEYCRFYWRPVRVLREIKSLRAAVLQRIQDDAMTRGWDQKNLIGILDHPTVKFMDRRVVRALKVVDACVESYGHAYVFLEDDSKSS